MKQLVTIVFNTYKCFGQEKQFSVSEKNYITHNEKWYTFKNGIRGAAIIPQYIVVKLKSGREIKDFDFARNNITNIGKIGDRSRSGYYILTIETEAEAFNTAKKLEKTGEFEEIRFVTCGERQSIPNDQYYNDQWNLEKIMMQEAWDIETGNNSLTIAILDGGVDYNHTDLNNNIWTNTGEISGDGVDNDQNGFIDDIRGWDFYGRFYDNGEPLLPYMPDNDPYDHDGHGTAMTGIAVAETNNNNGIAGISGGWSTNEGCN